VNGTERRGDAWFRRFVESSDTVLFIELDREGRIRRTNPAARRFLCRLGDPDGKPFAQFIVGLESADLDDLTLQFCDAPGQAGHVVELATSDQLSAKFLFRAEKVGDRLLLFGEPGADEIRNLRLEIQNLRNQFSESMRLRGKHSLERRQLLSGLEEAERQLERQARIDPVTGLANRREFLRAIRSEWTRYKRYGRPYSIGIAAVSGLNGLTGSQRLAGADAALVMAAELAASGLRESDQIARFGDRQFGFLLRETGSKAACLVAGRLHQAVSERKIALPAGGALGLTVGVSEVLPEHEHPEEALRGASAALRQAQETRRDVCLYRRSEE